MSETNRCAKCGGPRVTVGHGSLGIVYDHAFTPAPAEPSERMGAPKCSHGLLLADECPGCTMENPALVYGCQSCAALRAEVERLRAALTEIVDQCGGPAERIALAALAIGVEPEGVRVSAW